jgi:hypothetical protein
MHRYVVPQSVKDRVLRRQGKLESDDTINRGRLTDHARVYPIEIL